MNSFIERTKKFFRKITPNRIRWFFGPYIAYLAYLIRIYILKNKDAPKMLSINETIEKIIKENLSVIRFGDGEMSILHKTDLGFQKYDEVLEKKLKEIIKVEEKGLLICIPGLFGKIIGLAKFAWKFAMHHQFRYRQDWLSLLLKDRVYGDTLFTRPYLAYTNEFRKNSGQIFKRIFSIWEGKDVVLVEGEKSRLGVGNDMFKNTNSVVRILCPAENAFSKYEEILNACLKHSKDKLFLISLGPAAKVLAYDLFLAGYRVIDIGHIDMEYEMFLRKEKEQVKLKYKYLNEINERNPEECNDPEYLGQIIEKI